jgi:hypothetical protein
MHSMHVIDFSKPCVSPWSREPWLECLWFSFSIDRAEVDHVLSAMQRQISVELYP